MFLLLAMAAATACPGFTTPQVEACYSKKLDADMAAMRQYRQAALDRVCKIAACEDDKTVSAAFLKAEQAWYTYRDAECGAVYENWSQGTVRGLMAIQCRRRLTQQRTHAIWTNWLTYADRTPPILPEPPVGKER